MSCNASFHYSQQHILRQVPLLEFPFCFSGSASIYPWRISSPMPYQWLPQQLPLLGSPRIQRCLFSLLLSTLVQALVIRSSFLFLCLKLSLIIQRPSDASFLLVSMVIRLLLCLNSSSYQDLISHALSVLGGLEFHKFGWLALCKTSTSSFVAYFQVL